MSSATLWCAVLPSAMMYNARRVLVVITAAVDTESPTPSTAWCTSKSSGSSMSSPHYVVSVLDPKNLLSMAARLLCHIPSPRQ
jgi:hypothetical protein